MCGAATLLIVLAVVAFGSLSTVVPEMIEQSAIEERERSVDFHLVPETHREIAVAVNEHLRGKQRRQESEEMGKFRRIRSAMKLDGRRVQEQRRQEEQEHGQEEEQEKVESGLFEPKLDKVESNLFVEPTLEKVDEKATIVMKDSGVLQKRDEVKEAFLHAWRGYRAFAFGHDELSPTTNGTNDSWGGFGVTLVDALDTMMLMGLTDEVAAAREHVASIDFDSDYDASFFESTIRYLGGLLSAHSLSGDALYLAKAIELADRLMPAFNSPTGVPYSIVNLRTRAARNPQWNDQNSILSELGSVQLEFKWLSAASGEPRYALAAEKVMVVLRRLADADDKERGGAMPRGLYPVYVSPSGTGSWQSALASWGGLGDSFYEYLLKQWLLLGDEAALRMYTESVDALREHMVGTAHVGNWKYIGEYRHGQLGGGMDHLACYAPGTLALGSRYVAERREDLTLAIELMETCIALYRSQPTGLGPERVVFGGSGAAPFVVESPRYLLRPETIESLLMLYRVTGTQRYRDIGYQIFQSIVRYCKTPAGFSGIRDVTVNVDEGGQIVHDNSMQSFFLAETLKYLYLLFSDDDLPLDQFVFTTEAHPLRIRK
jgi:mannosyl-oligosaccharide alpha-1,2-mannosidase